MYKQWMYRISGSYQNEFAFTMPYNYSLDLVSQKGPTSHGLMRSRLYLFPIWKSITFVAYTAITGNETNLDKLDYFIVRRRKLVLKFERCSYGNGSNWSQETG